VFEVLARCPGSRARRGVLTLAHGTVQTPAFVPLATRGAVRTLESADVRALGYELILANTFHLMLAPGHDLVARLGGLHSMMRWSAPIITDSGGFQVFSLGHGGVADEIKSRQGAEGARRTAGEGGARASGPGAILSIEEAGVRFRSHIDGAQRFIGPELSMEVQAALGSDIALAFDECTPFHATRDYTARSMERTHRWLRRCLDWHERHGPPGQVVYGIVQGGVEHDLRLASVQEVAASGSRGVAIGGSLGADKHQMREVVGWCTAELDRVAPQRPRHLLGIGEVDDLIEGVLAGIDTFDCAMPTRLARHGVALVPDPPARWRLHLRGSGRRAEDGPILQGCSCPTCSAGYSRGYLRHLLRSREPTAPRLVTLHNLWFVAVLLADLRAGICAGALRRVASELLRGAAPGTAATSCTG